MCREMCRDEKLSVATPDSLRKKRSGQQRLYLSSCPCQEVGRKNTLRARIFVPLASTREVVNPPFLMQSRSRSWFPRLPRLLASGCYCSSRSVAHFHDADDAVLLLKQVFLPSRTNELSQSSSDGGRCRRLGIYAPDSRLS